MGDEYVLDSNGEPVMTMEEVFELLVKVKQLREVMIDLGDSFRALAQAAEQLAVVLDDE